MGKKKILFVNQDITPYVEDTTLATMGKQLPQMVQEAGLEIRTFMPRWGNINERRGQLHEVIRLSGTNIPIDDTDHPLIIKVASISGTKVQVYFIDNDEFFSRKGQLKDAEGTFYTDNGERAVFFARGVIETIKKLRWMPEVIHCQGAMAYLLPLYLKEEYMKKTDSEFRGVKVVTSLYGEEYTFPVEDNMKKNIIYGNITKKTLDKYSDILTPTELAKIAIDYSDRIIVASQDIDKDIQTYLDENAAKKTTNLYQDTKTEEYINFYDSL